LKFFLAIVIVSMMANEYSYGTLKQNLIDGMSKKEFILSKFLTVLAFAFASTLFVFVMSLLLGYSFSSDTEMSIVFSNMEYLLAFFVKLVGFFSFCLFLGILVRRSAFALGFLLVWNILEWIAKGILVFTIFPDKKIADAIIQFFPLESMSNLIVEPFSRLSVIKTIGTQIGANSVKDFGVHFTSILIVLGWSLLFTLFSYQLLKNRDL
jgi:ABC-type transport system involved in multi-copper enzyme maturation permease subunit